LAAVVVAVLARLRHLARLSQAAAAVAARHAPSDGFSRLICQAPKAIRSDRRERLAS
jgi:hypothetical protein